jgi:hypothetical protein
MEGQIQTLYSNAILLLRNLSTPNGIHASTIESDNYKRIWARDSIICGIAGLLAEDHLVIESLKASLVTLAKYQNTNGIIPSNVLITDNGSDVSYGSLVGRVDTNTWFIIGSCLYYLNTKDENTWEYLKPIIQKCRTYLKCIEFNDKGWIYTPLSGNWADEYPIQGYTLYDNSLRHWGESLWVTINENDESELDKIQNKIRINFWPLKDGIGNEIYHETSYKRALDKKISHFCSFILPGVYDTRFDAAGNALALLLFKLDNNQKHSLSEFIKTLKQDISKTLIPAFWPAIQKGDDDWHYIEGNYSYDFKNRPFNFHNGGIWPVWMGLFCLGLSNNDLNEEVKQIISDFEEITKTDNWNFQEYISSDSLLLKGKDQMGFTASGIVFMYHALKDNSYKIKLGL